MTVTSQAASYAEQLVMFKKRCKIGTWLLQTTNRKSLFSSIVQTRVWCMKWTGFWCYQCQVGADVERDSSDVEHQLCCVDGSQHCRRSGARELLRDNHRSVDILSSWRVKYWPSVSWCLTLFTCQILTIGQLTSCLVVCLECIRGESWKYSMGQKNGLHTFGYDSLKVNRFGWNLEQCEPTVGGWPWQILCAVATVREEAEILFFFVMRITHDFTNFLFDKFHDIWT